jgi:hypothetical protein
VNGEGRWIDGQAGAVATQRATKGHPLPQREQDLARWAVGLPSEMPSGGRATSARCQRGGGLGAVKKLLILALLVLGGFAIWRKVQAQRADLDLWSEATSSDDF